MRNRWPLAGFMVFGALLLSLMVAGCRGEKKMVQYSQLYREQPYSIYIAPIDDRSEHRPMRTVDDSTYNASISVAAKHLYMTAASPLVYKGYYVPGPLASAQLSLTEWRTMKQLRNESVVDYKEDLGVDAILFITVVNWETTQNTWSVELDYTLRSTAHGDEVMHTHVKATKTLPVDYKGRPRPLKYDRAFAQQYDCDLETAQRCVMVERVNEYVLTDLPFGSRARGNVIERHSKTHPEYFALHITTDGSVMVVPVDEEL